MSGLPLLEPSHFEGKTLKVDGKVVIFFYAKWCPFCRAACKETDCISDKDSYSAYAVDLSDEDNPLWDQLEIDIVPTLIGYSDGEEIYRKQGARMVGLRRRDFEAADSTVGGA
jgi:thiol-disulfide isomerase/thioredoxin